MKKLLIIFLLLVLCQINTVFAQLSSEYDSKIDYTQYRTFDWLTSSIHVGENHSYDMDSTNHYIKSNIEKALSTRGLIHRSHHPDILISYHIYTNHKQEHAAKDGNLALMYQNGFHNDWKYFPMGYINWPYQWNNNFKTAVYKEGTLIIDICTAKDKKLIWRGEISGGSEEKISKEISSLFKGYPLKKY